MGDFLESDFFLDLYLFLGGNSSSEELSSVELLLELDLDLFDDFLCFLFFFVSCFFPCSFICFFNLSVFCRSFSLAFSVSVDSDELELLLLLEDGSFFFNFPLCFA